MLVYKSEIWPKNHLPHTKSNCIGFKDYIWYTSYVHMCHIGSRKAKIQPQMAVSGNADIFSIKVDLRLKTILIHTGVAPEMDFSSVFL